MVWRGVFHGLSVVGLAGVVNTLPARGAEKSSFELSWQAPSECPTSDDLRGEIARLLGGTIQLPSGGELKAQATVEHEEKWSVTIVTEANRRAGRRLIEASSCRDLAMATSLIIALMIDPDAVAAQASVSQPAPPVVPAPNRSTPQKRESTWKFFLGLQGQISQGALPSFDVGPGAGIGLLSRRWRVELRGTYGLRRDQQAESPTHPGAFGRFNLATALLAGCINLGRTALAFGPCVDVEGGSVLARGFGVSEGFSTHRLWFAVGAGAYLAPSLGSRLSVPMHFDVLVPLARPEFVFTNVPGTVYQAPIAGWRFGVGLALQY